MLNQGHKRSHKRFQEKGNDTLLKELNQLHERNALLPKMKEDMTYDKRKKGLRYLIFLKKNEMGPLKQEDVLMEEANVVKNYCESVFYDQQDQQYQYNKRDA